VTFLGVNARDFPDRRKKISVNGGMEMKNLSVAQELANFCQSLKYVDFSDELIRKVKDLFSDFIAVASRGGQTDISRSMLKAVLKLSAEAKRTGVLIGRPESCAHAYAALANGTFAHVLSMDDVHSEATLHPGATIFPACLAASEMASEAGQKFIEGVVLGYEVMIRLSKALGVENQFERGFHPTGICGTFGCAVAVSKILNLNEDQIVNALGIAGSQAAGLMEFLASGACSKRMHTGWAAHSGIVAAQLALEGLSGPSTIFEGKNGFIHAYSGNGEPKELINGLGSSFEILSTGVKPHACCRFKQPAIDAILGIMADDSVEPSDIERVTVAVLKTGIPVVAEPKEQKQNPKSTMDAQFSMPFGAAVAILYGVAGVDEYCSPQLLESPEVKAMMAKVECVSNETIEKEFPKHWGSIVEILDKDGRQFRAEVKDAKGDPANPLTPDEMKAKFFKLTKPIYPKDQIEEILENVDRLDSISDIGELAMMLQNPS